MPTKKVDDIKTGSTIVKLTENIAGTYTTITHFPIEEFLILQVSVIIVKKDQMLSLSLLLSLLFNPCPKATISSFDSSRG